MMPENIASKVRLLEENSHVGLVYSACTLIDSAGKTIGVRRPFSDSYTAPIPVEFERLVFDNHVPYSTVMFRRSCYERLGGFDERSIHNGDYDLWLRIALHYDVAYLTEALVKERMHPESYSAQTIPSGAVAEDTIACLEENFDRLPQPLEYLKSLRSKALACTRLRFAGYAYAASDIPHAQFHLAQALRDWPHLLAEPESVFEVLYGPGVKKFVSDNQDYLDAVFTNLPP
jgi:hypothetical protein